MTEALTIAVSGLRAAVAKVTNAASNLVNASSTGHLPQTPGGQATSYQPTDVITISDSVGDNELGVHTQTVVRNPAYVSVSDPHSPDANAAGLIAAPNVDIAAEIIDTKIAEVAYKANAAVIRAQAKMDKELDRMV